MVRIGVEKILHGSADGRSRFPNAHDPDSRPKLQGDAQQVQYHRQITVFSRRQTSKYVELLATCLHVLKLCLTAKEE